MFNLGSIFLINLLKVEAGKQVDNDFGKQILAQYLCQ